MCKFSLMKARGKKLCFGLFDWVLVDLEHLPEVMCWVECTLNNLLHPAEASGGVDVF